MTKYSQAELTNVLKTSRTIAVVGISPKSDRPSYHVTEYLIEQGYEIYGVNPDAKEILGRPCYPSLADIPVPIDIVDVFRKSDAVPEITKQAVNVKAKALWLQEGVQHPESEDYARKNGLFVVSDRCILKEHVALTR